MKYFEAESMRQEMIVAMQYNDVTPNQYVEVAKKYTAKQWVECGKAVLVKLEEDKKHIFELLALVEAIRKGEGKNENILPANIV
jgi:predicted RNA-binding protein (virulence factor B family)